MTDTMRTVRFHEYGEPGDVLRLEPQDVARLAVLMEADGAHGVGHRGFPRSRVGGQAAGGAQ